MTVLVAEPLAEAAVALLKSQPGWNMIVSNPKEYAKHLAEADALIVRSAVQVNQAVLDQAPKLRVIGRAGVGVDNVDLDAATAAGVLVMNTPGGNAISVAEHTLALMLAMARRIPQATQSTTGGKWEKKKFLGSELRGKTLGIVGLGSIGREVVKRARAFEMRVQAHDPYVTAQIAKDLGVDAGGSGGALRAERLHHAARGADARDGGHAVARRVRADEAGRAHRELRARRTDRRRSAAAGASNRAKWPAPRWTCLRWNRRRRAIRCSRGNKVLATPHIGGSTEEAQEIVGVRIAEQVVEYLKNGVALNAVNMPALSPEQYRALGPYIDVAERLGNFAAYIAAGHVKTVRLAYFGRIGENNTSLLRNAGLAGVLKRSMSERANLINAMQIAGQRGWNLAERHEARSGHTDSIRLELETDCGVTVVEGAVLLGKPRLIQVDGIYCEAPLSGHLIFMKNHDVPGVIGHVGTVLGRNNINIANFSLGRGEVPRRAGRAAGSRGGGFDRRRGAGEGAAAACGRIRR